MKLIFPLLLVLTSFPAAASEILGAFGFKFSERVNTETLSLIEVTDLEGNKYQFSPANPYGNLQSYFVYVTPKTKTAYKIQANAQFDSSNTCEAELEALANVFEAKYGKRQEDISALVSGIPTIRFSTGPRRIVGTCNTYISPKELTLTYIDDGLSETEQL